MLPSTSVPIVVSYEYSSICCSLDRSGPESCLNLQCLCSTPAISKMHSDDSPELKLVEIVLEDIFEVSCFFPVMVSVTKSVSILQ